MEEADRDSESGRFERSYSDRVFIEAVKKHAPASTQEIADVIGIHRRSAQHRLDALADSNDIDKKKVGNSLVWSVDTTTRHERAFEAFSSQMLDQWADEIERLILYGSTARGEARGIDSDVDVMVVTASPAARDAVYDPAYEIAFDVMLEHGVALSLNFKTEDELDEQSERRYVKNVLQEGCVYGSGRC